MNTRATRVDPVSFVANQLKLDISSPRAFVGDRGVGAALNDTGIKLGAIGVMKQELAKQQGQADEPSHNRGLGGFTELGIAGISFAAGDIVGGAVSLALGAKKLGSSLQHQGTINFGEKGVQGGELASAPQSSDIMTGKYVDAEGQSWNSSTGLAFKEEPMVAIAPQTVDNSPYGRLQRAAQDAAGQYSQAELDNAVYGVGKLEKQLMVANGGLASRAEKLGFALDEFNLDQLGNSPLPPQQKMPLKVGMMGAPNPSGHAGMTAGPSMG